MYWRPVHIWPAKGPGSVNRSGVRIRSNSISAVISITVAGSSLALLPGDIDHVGLKDLLKNTEDQSLRARILLYPPPWGPPRRDESGQLRENAAPGG